MNARERLRDEDRARILKLSPDERVRLALDLGERSLELLCAAQGLTRSQARAFAREARDRARRRAR